MHVTGIVRASNLVRNRLQNGLGHQELEQFQNQVRNTVQQVEQICRRHGVTPGALPLPSRNAYRFLKELDLNKLPVRSGDSKPPVAPVKRFNVVRSAGIFQRQFWRELDELQSCEQKREQVSYLLSAHVESLQAAGKDSAATVAALPPPSRRAYCWMKFLGDQQVLSDHLAALRLAREVAALNGLKVQVQLANMRSLWRYNKAGDTYNFKIHEGFLHAPLEVWKALLKLRVDDSRAENLLVREFAHSEMFAEVSFALEAFAAETSMQVSGAVHDLQASFNRVNAEYFGGKMPRPVLTWNKVVTARKFGHYDSLRDTVMVSISLDHESVPEFVIDSVVHHELLHKKHGVTFVNGRRITHSHAFRKEERTFVDYDKADKIIGELARKYRSR